MILPNYSAFRYHFSVRAETLSTSLTYAAGTPATITRGAGSFVTDGFEAGMYVKILGTTNNTKEVLLDTAAALTLTLDTDETLTAEGPVTSSLVGVFYENDRKERWPTELVRANGFDTLTIPRPIVDTPFDITCNGGATDAADGTTYTWFVSQRSAEPTTWMWNVSTPDLTKSGTIRFTATSVAVNELGLAIVEKMKASHQVRALRNVFVYVKRESDGAIQMAELFTASNALT